MSLHSSTFAYLKPTQEQMGRMSLLRADTENYARALELGLPDGPDKTHILRSLRTLAMWVNVAITRHADGTPRDEMPAWDGKAQDADK